MFVRRVYQVLMINGLQTIARIVDFLEHELFQIEFPNRYHAFVMLKFGTQQCHHAKGLSLYVW